MNCSNNETDRDDALSIAVIGMSGRFPGADNLSTFWENLRGGVESIRHFSQDELARAGVAQELLESRHYVRAGGWLDGKELFDAGFFGFTPREAETTDPQQRMFLEAAWEALEHAGYGSVPGGNAIGVFAGAGRNEYFLNHILRDGRLPPSSNPMQILVGNDKDSLCTAVAYRMNLKGPAISVQTACSSSLVAVHMACQSILNGECDMALAGGVSLGSMRPEGYLHVEGGIHSKDGHCRAFDAQASGTVPGSGLGVMVLKGLAQAIQDGDTIHAVVLGSAVNNDGSSKIGYTAPSVAGQAAVVREALSAAGIDARSVSYLETHGTGTTLGDPIEVRALQEAYGALTADRQFCAIGSLKTNIGHLDTAAGVAGMIKAVLALGHREIPPSLHFREPNSHIDFDHSAFHVASALTPWNPSTGPRRSAVSSFGIGGTNAHVILEEAPPAPPRTPSRQWHLLLLSAKSAAALDAATVRMREFLLAHPEADLADIAYTCQVGRQHFGWRRAIVCANIDDAVRRLEAALATPAPSPVERTPELAFMFPGQGTQYVGMARELYASEALFRTEVDRCCVLLEPAIGMDLRTVLFPRAEEAEQATALLNRTNLTQPALFVVEYALARQFEEWAIRPASMIGHSIGEYVAACLAGVMELHDALSLVAARGRLVASLPEGRMIAVHAPEPSLGPVLGDGSWIAAVNSPSMCVVSGTRESVRDLEMRLTERGIAFQPLHTSHAFHSGMMEPILPEFGALLAAKKLRVPKIRYVSNVTGQWTTDADAVKADHWVAHLRQPVRFCDGLATVVRDRATPPLLLEVGPGRVLSALAKQNLRGDDRGTVAVASLPGAAEPTGALESVLAALGQLWTHGLSVNWKSFHAHGRRRRVPIPTYPFERTRHWIERGETAASRAGESAIGARSAEVRDWLYAPVWERGAFTRSTLQASKSGDGVHLVFMDRDGTGEEVLAALDAGGAELVVVTPSSGPAAATDGSYRIDPSAPGHYEFLAKDLAGKGKTPSRIVYLWALGPSLGDGARSPSEVFCSLLVLAQAMGRTFGGAPMDFTVVTNGVYSVTGDERLHPEQATAIGPSKVVPIEYPRMRWKHVDLALEERRPLGRVLARALANEIRSAAPDGSVAYRGAYRWTPSVRELAAMPTGPAVPHRRDGTYLVTGGLGGLGLVFAEYLAERFERPTIVLTGRSPFPERETWGAYTAGCAQPDATAEQIACIRRIEGRGAAIRYVMADITNEQDMQRLQRSIASSGKLHGIVHAAGLPGDGLVAGKSRESALRILAPKVEGTLLLARSFPPEQLDFMLLCSSLNAWAPVAGQVDYCAANAFMDAWAHQQQLERGANVLSIDWCAWRDAGMARAAHAQAAGSPSQGDPMANAISNDEAARVLDMVLAVPLPQVVVSPMALLDARRRLTVGGAAPQEPAGAAAPRQRGASADAAPPVNATQERLLAIWERQFGMAGIGVHDDFFALGGHSLLATQVLAELRDAFDVDLPLRAIFEAPTVALLAARVEEQEAGRDGPQRAKRSAFIATTKQQLDGMSAEQLAALLEEKRRLKAQRQQPAATSSEKVARRPL